MNDNHLSSILHTIVEKDIPDDMNVLQSIHEQLEARQQVNLHQSRQMMRVLVAVITPVFLFMGTIAAYAMYQTFFGDPGLEGAVEQGLVQEIDRSISMDGITVTVQQAFADSNRIAIWWTLEDYPFPEEGELFGLSMYTSLLNMDGSMFSTDAMSNSSADGVNQAENGTLESLTTFDHNAQIPENGVLDVIFSLNINGQDVYLLPDDFDWNTLRGPLPEEYAYEAPSAGLFEFDLALNVSEPILLEPALTMTSNGIDLTLESVEIAPSQTNILLCFELPDPRDWQPRATLTINDTAGLLSGFRINGNLPAPDDVERCFDMSFLASYHPDAKEIRIVVDGLQTSVPAMTPEVLERARERLLEDNIEVEFSLDNRGMTYEIVSAPDDMTEADTGLVIFDAMRDDYDGKWEFTLPLP